jgi:hypothetical protein
MRTLPYSRSKPERPSFITPMTDGKQSESIQSLSITVLQMLSTLKRRAPLSLTGLSLLFIALSVLVKAVGTLWIKKQISALTREYSA